LPGHDTLIKLPGQGSPSINYVSPDFFATTGMRLIRGRAFEESDRDDGPVVIVSQAMANLYWPGRDPIGECVYVQRQTTCTTVVGVVKTQHMFRIQEVERLFYYRPLRRLDAEIGTVLFRSRMSPSRAKTVVSRALQELESDLPYVDVSELVSGFEAELRPWRLGVTIFTGFGALSMLLAAIGLAASISYSVTERSREIGVRIAVGASRWHVLALVLREGLAIGVAGIIAAVAIAVAAAPWLGDLLYKVSPRDTFTFGIVGAVVLVIVLLASASPARRASRIHPMRVLTID
jgi:ABC-type antimicrobial peptide transport system permease subunit